MKKSVTEYSVEYSNEFFGGSYIQKLSVNFTEFFI